METRECRICMQDKPLDCFTGRAWHCRRCCAESEKVRLHYERRRLIELYVEHKRLRAALEGT